MSDLKKNIFLQQEDDYSKEHIQVQLNINITHGMLGSLQICSPHFFLVLFIEFLTNILIK